ncbi:MAG: ATP-binding cassette domain-containing protein [Treponema sp.]|nr:ATP-binding cassette domain-containing protein [Treponema sp.]
MSLLSVKDVSFSFPESEKVVLDSVSFSIEHGEYAVILGANGSGKSTMARIIAGFLEIKEGSVQLAEGARTGIVFQYPKDQIVSGIVSRDTAFGPENLKLSPAEVEQRVIESLSVSGMLDRADSRTNALSLGQTQKLAISGILALHPDLLVLDEATSMLDPESRADILDFLDACHKNGQSILHITHDYEEACRAQHVIVIQNGELIFDGSKEKFKANTALVRHIFGEPVQPAVRAADDFADAEIALAFRDIEFAYEDRPVLKGLNLDIYKGSLTAITGVSGSGKSTLMEIAAGLLMPSGGKVYADGYPSLALQDSQAALFEAYAADDVAFGPKNQGVRGKELKKRVREAMDMVGLPFEQFADRSTQQLSGGEKRKLSIAGIIAMNSSVLLFDEPTSGIDPISRKQLLLLLQKLAREGKTILFSTHRMEEAAFADRAIHMENCAIVSDSANKPLAPAESIALETKKSLDGAKMLSKLRKTAAFATAPAKVNGLIQKFPPVWKYVAFLAIFVGSLCMQSVYLAAGMAVVAVAYAVLAKYPVSRLFSSFLKVLPWMLLYCLIQLIFFPARDGEPHLTEWKWFMITPFKIHLCVLALIRVFGALSAVQVFIYSTGEKEILEGFATLLKPLSALHLPVRSLVVVTEIIFRFIPILIEEASSIIKTQLERGGLGTAKGFFMKIKILFPLFIPLIIQTLRRAEVLADALTARYF